MASWSANPAGQWPAQWGTDSWGHGQWQGSSQNAAGWATPASATPKGGKGLADGPGKGNGKGEGKGTGEGARAPPWTTTYTPHAVEDPTDRWVTHNEDSGPQAPALHSAAWAPTPATTGKGEGKGKGKGKGKGEGASGGPSGPWESHDHGEVTNGQDWTPANPQSSSSSSWLSTSALVGKGEGKGTGKGKGKGKGEGASTGPVGRDNGSAESHEEPTDDGDDDSEATLARLLEELQRQKAITANDESEATRRLRAKQGQSQEHYNFVMVDRDDYGCDKFFGGTRGIPPEWAAFVYFNRNTNNAPREYPQGFFDLVPTIIGGRKSKPGAPSNSFFDIHFKCGEILQSLVAPEQTKFFVVCGERDRYPELHAQLKAAGCRSSHFNGHDKDFGKLLEDNFVPTEGFYWSRQPLGALTERTGRPSKGKGKGAPRSHSAFR